MSAVQPYPERPIQQIPEVNLEGIPKARQNDLLVAQNLILRDKNGLLAALIQGLECEIALLHSELDGYEIIFEQMDYPRRRRLEARRQQVASGNAAGGADLLAETEGAIGGIAESSGGYYTTVSVTNNKLISRTKKLKIIISLDTFITTKHKLLIYLNFSLYFINRNIHPNIHINIRLLQFKRRWNRTQTQLAKYIQQVAIMPRVPIDLSNLRNSQKQKKMEQDNYYSRAIYR